MSPTDALALSVGAFLIGLPFAIGPGIKMALDARAARKWVASRRGDNITFADYERFAKEGKSISFLWEILIRINK